MSQWSKLVLHEITFNRDTLQNPTHIDTKDVNKQAKADKVSASSVQKQLADKGLTPEHEPNENRKEFISRLMITSKADLQGLAKNCEHWLDKAEEEYKRTGKLDQAENSYLGFAKGAFNAIKNTKRMDEYMINSVLAKDIFSDKNHLSKEDYETAWDVEMDTLGNTVSTDLEDDRYKDAMQAIVNVRAGDEDMDWENDNSPFQIRLQSDAGLRQEYDDLLSALYSEVVDENDKYSLYDIQRNLQKVNNYIEKNGGTPVQLEYPDNNFKERFSALGL